MAVIILGSQPAVDEDFEPEVTGAPSMVVDNDTQNYGNVSFGQPVNAVFTLRNVGDEPLRILGEPSVELVRGC
ncbi:MAG: hypothetical protein SF029_19375 [bacterium]|nr:hypothetical protein [bacterium]